MAPHMYDTIFFQNSFERGLLRVLMTNIRVILAVKVKSFIVQDVIIKCCNIFNCFRYSISSSYKTWTVILLYL